MASSVKNFQSEAKCKTLLIFSIVGVVGLAVEISLVGLLYEFFGFSALLSKALAFPLAVLVTWILNRNLTFRERTGNGLFTELFRYANVTLIGAVVNNTLYILVISLLGAELVTALFAVATGSLAGLTANFFGSNRYVFVEHAPKE